MTETTLVAQLCVPSTTLAFDSTGTFLVRGDKLSREVGVHELLVEGPTSTRVSYTLHAAAYVAQVAVSAEAKHVAVASVNGDVTIYDLSDEEEYGVGQTLRKFGYKYASGVAVTSNLSHIAAAFARSDTARDALVVLYEVDEEGKAIEMWVCKQAAWIGRVQMAEEAKVLAFAVGTGDQATIKYVVMESVQQQQSNTSEADQKLAVRRIAAQATVMAAFDLSSDGGTLVVLGKGKIAEYVRSKKRFEERAMEEVHVGALPFCAVSSDGKDFVAGGMQHLVRIVVREDSVLEVDEDDSDDVTELGIVQAAVHRDRNSTSTLVAIAYREGCIKVWRY